MSAILMRLRAELRGGWRAWLGLALLIGIAGGAATAAAAGARRTESAYPRFLRAHDGFHALTGGGAEEGYEQTFEQIRNLPEVEDSSVMVLVGGSGAIPASGQRPELRFDLFQEMLLVTDPEGRAYVETNKPKMLSGRQVDPAALDEVVVPFTFSDRHGLAVGDQIIAGIGFDFETFGPVVEVPMKIVGIRAAPGDFDALGQPSLSFLSVPPAVLERYEEILPPMNPDTWNLGVHLRGGPEAARAFEKKVEQTFMIDVPLVEPSTTAGVQETMRLYVAALWIISAVIAIAATTLLGQSLSRQMMIESADHDALRGLGMGRAQLFLLGMLRASLIAAAALPIAVMVAWLASPLTPIGAARVAEPDPGFRFDAFTISLGAAAMTLAILLAALWPAWRAARRGQDARAASEARSLPLLRLVGRGTRSPAAVTGVRMAIDPGRGASFVPIRSTIVAVAVGIAAMTAALVVGRSLQHLIDTPALAGYTYDAILPSGDDEDDRARATALSELDFVEGVATGTAFGVTAGEVTVLIVAFSDQGDVRPAIIDGRAPTSALNGGLPEIALGARTVKRLGVRLGDPVTLGVETHDGPGSLRARVVGTAAIPTVPWDAAPPAEGGVMTLEALAAVVGDHGGGCCFVRFAEGADLDAARTTLIGAGYETILRGQRSDLGTLERITALPLVLTALFGGLSLGALAHVLITGIRRRRRDLAILKTIGFVGAQIRSTVAWQASAITFLCVGLGVPAAIVLGRWGWTLVADRFGVVPVSMLPVITLLALPAIAVALANVIAIGPARAAVRTAPAVVLRGE